MEKSTLSPKATTSCTSIDSTRIPFLPAPTLEQVLFKLNQNDVAQARLVCPNWRTIIDNNYRFSIKIKEKSFEELPIPFKVKACYLYKLKKNVKKIFMFPDVVENLNLGPKCNTSTLRNIFAETINLKELNFNTNFDFYGDTIYMPEESICFKNLLQLAIFYQRGYYVRGNALPRNTERLFFYEMPVLKKLYFRMFETCNELERLFPSFFRFLAKHSKTIELLRATFIPDLPNGYHGIPVIFENIFNGEEAQTIIEKLHDPAFQLLHLILALPNIYSHLWDRIIENQNKLITFYVECTDEVISFATHRVFLYAVQPTLYRNASTLETLHLPGLTLEENQNRDVDPSLFIPIDGLVFRDLNKLRRLILIRHRGDYIEHRMIQPDVSTITNIHEIPSDLLEVLEISRFFCETSELETLVEKAPRLKIVIFHETGVTIGKGATMGIIDNLTKKSDIHIIDVFPLKTPHDNEEKKKFKELEQQNAQAFRYNGRHYYFNFDRLRKGLEQEAYRPYLHPFYLQ